jgi:hypothetical protein
VEELTPSTGISTMTKQCARCLMPDTYPDIIFDSNGVCNHCLEYKEIEILGEERFLQKIHSKRGEQYDCVLGISGGKDSSYVAYLAKKKFGLRPLAVSYDFPFMVDLARKNIKAVCDSLGIDLIVVKSRNDLEYKLMRNHLMSLATTGTTWGQCMFCHYGIEAVLYDKAKSNGIPFILSGVTPNETWWNPGSRMGFLVKHLKKLPLAEQARFGFYQSRAYMRLVDQRLQFPIPGNNPLNVYGRASVPADGPETIPVFQYIDWDQDLIERTLKEETGWQKPNKELSWRYDCILEPLLDYTFKKEFGISSAGLYICGLVRSGRLSREEALRLTRENEDQEKLDANLRTVLDYLNIPAPIQQKFLNASPERN